MPAFYNEIDPFAAAWLEGLTADGLIAPGVVNRSSIVDLRVAEVAAATQAHFFAGIGGWSYALRLAGWPDDVPVWTGSCPCQPFSTAGRRRGRDDDRHLWPAFYDLIRKCRPPVVLGEQVASPDGLDWLDAVLSDLERAGYTVGTADLCAAGFGAPHLRQRLYFVALADGQRLERVRLQLRQRRPREDQPQVDGGGGLGVVADTAERGRREGDEVGPRGGAGAVEGDRGHRPGDDGEGRELADADGRQRGEHELQRRGGSGKAEAADVGEGRELADADEVGRGTGQPRGDAARQQPDEPGGREAGVVGDALRGGGPGDDRGLPGAQARGGRQVGDGPEPPGAPGVVGDAGGQGPSVGPWRTDGRGALWLEGPTPAEAGACGGPWAGARWHACRDGKGGVVLRPAQPGIHPLASRVPGRVGLIRGAGNSIVSEVAKVFVETVIEYICEGSKP